MRKPEVTRETLPYFECVRARPIQIVVPGGRRFGLPIVAISRVAEKMPLVRTWGQLLLLTAERPIHPPTEGVPPKVPWGLRSLVRWCRRILDRARGAEA